MVAHLSIYKPCAALGSHPCGALSSTQEKAIQAYQTDNKDFNVKCERRWCQKVSDEGIKFLRPRCKVLNGLGVKNKRHIRETVADDIIKNSDFHSIIPLTPFDISPPAPVITIIGLSDDTKLFFEKLENAKTTLEQLISKKSHRATILGAILGAILSVAIVVVWNHIAQIYNLIPYP